MPRTSIKSRITRNLVFLILLSLPVSAVFPAGTVREGWMVVQIEKFGSDEYVWKSYEGVINYASFDDDEECDEEEHWCYTPILETHDFSVKEDNKQLAYFLKENVGKTMLIHYKKHRTEPWGMKSRLEVTEAYPQLEQKPEGIPDYFAVEKTGSARNFWIYGLVLKLEREGVTYSTWEGMYYDKQRDRVHLFSVSQDSMAQALELAMKSETMYYLGISEARVTWWRHTDLDIFEINYKKKPDVL